MAKGEERPWKFITNHARALIVISKNPEIRLRDLAQSLSITERSAQRIVAELEEAGDLTHEKIGRRNLYNVNFGVALRHPNERTVEIGQLLELFSSDSVAAQAGAS